MTPLPDRLPSRGLRAAATVLLAAVLAPVWGCGSAPRFDGPVAARNQHPAQLLVGRMRPRSAAPVDSGRAQLDWRNAYSSLFLSGEAGGDAFQMDGEYLRSGLGVRVGLGGGFDVETEVAVAHASGGFLDDFVVAWHDAFGFPQQGRDEAPTDRFAVDARDDGATVFEVEPHGLHLLDMPLLLSWSPVRLSEEQPFGLLFRGGVELPTGEQDAGYGSGGADWMLGAVVEWRTGPVAWNAHVEHTWAATPDAAAAQGFTFADVPSLGFGAELAASDTLTLLAQIEMDRATLRRLDVRRASEDQWLLWAAARIRLADGFRLEAGIGEDLSQYTSPDFTAWLALSFDLGG